LTFNTVKHLGVDVVNAARADIAFVEFNALYTRVCEQINQGFEIPEVADDEVLIKRKKPQGNIPRLTQLIR
jgi:hypothetical protein